MLASLLPPLLSLTVLAAAQPAPVAPAAPAVAAERTSLAPVAEPATAAPAAAPLAIERRVGPVFVRRGPDGAVFLTPGPTFAFTPGPDESGDVPRWFELVLPAGGRREFTARTETLFTVPKGIVLELENLLGDINVEAWDKDAVRIVAEHDRRDRMRARLVGLHQQGEALRRHVDVSRVRVERDRQRAESDRGRTDRDRRRAQGGRDRDLGVESGLREGLAARLEQGTLQIETLSRQGVPRPVDYTITVPRWMPLRLSGMETDISVVGVGAAIAAQSIRGDVKVRGGRGPLQISSVEGMVRAFDCQGNLEASSINSDVELDDVSGVLVVESINGDIHIGRVRSQDVEASSVNGTVVYGGAFEPRGHYRLASHAGNLVVGVPVGAGIDVSVATFQGGFRSGFPMQLKPWRKGQKFNFVLGAGGSSLELESFQGLIELLRPSEVPSAPSAVSAPKAQKPAKIVRVHRAPTPPTRPTPPDTPEPEEDK